MKSALNGSNSATIDNAPEEAPSPTAARPRFRFQAQGSTQTLAEGLAEHRAGTPGLIDPDAVPPRAAALFRNHDIAHIVFGCDTSIHQEVLIDFWTIFGSDVGLTTYLDYIRMPESMQILKDIGFFRAFTSFFGALPDVFRVIARARRMRTRWPWEDHEGYMDRPLAEIREELNIRVLS